MSKHRRLVSHRQRSTAFCRAALLTLLLAACGQARATPTPLPPDVVRPVQPTPAYGNSQQFSLTTPPATRLATPPTPPGTPPNRPTPTAIAPARLLIEQPPSAMGIATGGAVLLAEPDGALIKSLPVGEVVTVIGRSPDERYWAAYTHDFTAGWVAAGQLAVYGGEDLVTVETVAGPAPIATLLAAAMEPVEVLATLVATPPE